MYMIKVVGKKTLMFYGLLIFLTVVSVVILAGNAHAGLQTLGGAQDTGWETIVAALFDIRNECVLNGDFDALEKIYLTSERNGRWAYENEIKRSEYLAAWAAKQGAHISGITSNMRIRRVKEAGRGFAFYIVASSEYEYVYADDPDATNRFRLGTYHSLDLVPKEDTWIISREWYDDPLSGTLKLSDYPEDAGDTILAQSPKDPSQISARRVAAVAYADMHCGAASDGQTGFAYNKKYTDYNSLGGDCANFVSQILYEGGGFKKNTIWNYKNGKGSYAWIKARALTDFLLYSGRASLLSKGKYQAVCRHAYRLLPGDIVAYAKKGKIAHIALVTGLDSKGYPLVNCHNADRYRVPWDIGWNPAETTFYLIGVHY